MLAKPRAFRSGWATNLAAQYDHFYQRFQAGPAFALCEGDAQLAGKLYEAHGARCQACASALLERSAKAAEAAISKPHVSPARIETWNRRIVRLTAYMTRMEMRDRIDHARLRRADALKQKALALGQAEVAGKRRLRQWSVMQLRNTQPQAPLTATARFIPYSGTP